MRSDWGEILRIFSMSLHTRLKEKINASIFVKIDKDDVLHVVISKFDTRVAFDRENVSMDIARGNMDQIVYDIVSGYKRHVMKTYFY